MPRVQHISERPDLLDAVIQLGKANRATLGFLPDGAFEDHARKNRILVAVEDGRLKGYVLYRVSREKATVVHLCVGTGCRGEGVARALVSELFDVTADLRGIGLQCRQDYEANAVWPKLGFYHVSSRPGRSQEGHPLALWWFDHGKTDLFSMIDDGRLDVVIDANVFYDIIDSEGGRPDAGESLALVADWLEPHLRLMISPEIYNEADRNPTSEGTERTKSAARSYPALTYSGRAFQEAQKKARQIVPPREASRERDLSDLNHLASAAAANKPLFVTRDGRLLDHADEIEAELGLSVLRPVELILHLDDLHGSAGPEPVWLSGSKLEVVSVRDYDEDALSEAFYSTGRGEKKGAFLRHIRLFLTAPNRFQTEVVTGDGEALALIVVDRSEEGTLRIPMLRVSTHPGASAVAQSLLFQAVRKAVAEDRPFVVLDEQLLSTQISDWLSKWGFAEDGDRYVKLAIPLASDRSGVLDRLGELAETGRHPYVVETISVALRNAHPAEQGILGDVERLLWPCKLLDEDIPTFIVAIKPFWALNLFDERLADQTLFGAPRELALSREGVYYRAKHPDPNLCTPGRILWYVSSRSKQFPEAGAIRACSVIDRVDIGTPGALYKRYARLGTYKWDDVFKVAKRDRNKEIMAIQFSDTELFDRPVLRERLGDILPENVSRANLVSPVRVSSGVFETIYTSALTTAHRGDPRRTNRPHVDSASLRRSDL